MPSTHSKRSSSLYKSAKPIHTESEPGGTSLRTKSFSSALWIDVKLLLIRAQELCASNQVSFSVKTLKHEFWKRSQSGVKQIAVEKNSNGKSSKATLNIELYKVHSSRNNKNYQLTTTHWHFEKLFIIKDKPKRMKSFFFFSVPFVGW